VKCEITTTPRYYINLGAAEFSWHNIKIGRRYTPTMDIQKNVKLINTTIHHCIE
jgi:hypothetical protein